MNGREPKKQTALSALEELAKTFSKVQLDEKRRAEVLALECLLQSNEAKHGELRNLALTHYQMSLDYDYAATQVNKICTRIDTAEIDELL